MNQKRMLAIGLGFGLILTAVTGAAFATAAEKPFVLWNNAQASNVDTNQTGSETPDGFPYIEAPITAFTYPAITMEAGKPVTLNFKAEEGTLNACNNEIIIPEFGIDLKLVEGDNLVTITSEKTGEFAYSCWMNMIQSKITVVEPGSVAVGATVEDPANQQIQTCPMMVNNASGGSCCDR